MVVAFIALTPLYMYHKSMFLTFNLGSIALQTPTLSKDICAIFILLVIFCTYCLRNPLFRFNRSQYMHFSFLIILPMIAFGQSLIFGNSFNYTIIGLRPYLLFPVLGAYFAIFFHCDTKILNISFQWILLGCVAIGLVCVIQNSHPGFLMHPTIGAIWMGKVVHPPVVIGGRLSGFLTNPNVLAWFMSIGLLLATWSLYKAKQSISYFGFAALIPIFVVILLWTQSRSGIIGVYLSLVLWCHLTGRRVLLKTFILFALLTTPIIATQIDRYSLEQFLANPRLSIWSQLLLKIISSPRAIVFGNGLGTAGRFGVETSGLNQNGFQSELSFVGDYVIDNVYLQTFFQSGLIGLLLIAWVFTLYFQCIAIVRSMGHDAREFLSLPIMLMTYIITISFFGMQLYTYPWNMIFFLCAFFILGYDKSSKQPWPNFLPLRSYKLSRNKSNTL